MAEYYLPDGTGPYYTEEDPLVIPPGAIRVPVSTEESAEYTEGTGIDITSNVVSLSTATQNAIAANTAKRSYPIEDETKLAGIEESADANPVQVSVAEKTAGTSTELRLFSPADIVDMINTHK